MVKKAIWLDLATQHNPQTSKSERKKDQTADSLLVIYPTPGRRTWILFQISIFQHLGDVANIDVTPDVQMAVERFPTCLVVRLQIVINPYSPPWKIEEKWIKNFSPNHSNDIHID